MLIVSQLGGKLAQRAIDVGERRRAPVARDGVDERVGRFLRIEPLGDLGPEIVRVRLRSVKTIQLGRHDGGQ